MDKQTEPLPEGKVRTVSGEIIDRADACYLLRPVPGTSLLMDSKEVIYQRDARGTLRRYPQKEKKNKKNKHGKVKNEDQ